MKDIFPLDADDHDRAIGEKAELKTPNPFKF